MKKCKVLVVMMLCAGCIPTAQQVNTLTNNVDELMTAVDSYQEEFAEEVDKVQADIVVVNEAVKEKADENVIEQIKAGWDETKDYNPYYIPGALILTILGEAGALWKLSKKNTGLEKGISRVKGESEPALAKKIHDTLKIYT